MMCACEPGFMCARCRNNIRALVDLFQPDWREVEQEQAEYDLTRVDFREPMHQ